MLFCVGAVIVKRHVSTAVTPDFVAVTEITQVPAPTTVITPPDTVATDSSELPQTTVASFGLTEATSVKSSVVKIDAVFLSRCTSTGFTTVST